MNVKIKPQTVKEIVKTKIPTRFDDIQKEIAKAEADKYYNQYACKNPDSTYTLGNVISEALGQKLNKIV